MLSKTKLLIVAVLALAAISFAATSASAASLQMRPGGAITATSLGKMTFESNIFGLGPECRVEMIGTLLTTVVTKVEGAKLGEITRVVVTECTGGTATATLVTTAAPATIQYASITGTLPEGVTAALIRIAGIGFLIEVPAVNSRCLYIATIGASTPTTRIGAGTYTTGLFTVLSGDQRYTRITSLNANACPTAPTLFGTFRFPVQTITRT
jgi:hypothetical protein